MSEKDVLKIEERSGYLWITLPDSITMYNNREIEQEIGRALHDRKEHVILDFTHTQTVYSSGLGLMIRVRRFVTERGGTLSLVNVSEPVFEMFVALNINKVFNIYATDVEFEISQSDFLEKAGKNHIGFLFIAKVENECYRMHFSGDMVESSDFSSCRKFEPSPVISLYLIDMSGLEMIDSAGAEELNKLTKHIASGGGECRAYGSTDVNRDMLISLGADKYLAFFPDEKTAFEGTGQL